MVCRHNILAFYRENQEFGHRGLQAAIADPLARGSLESWRAQNMYNKYPKPVRSTQHPQSTPLVLPTSPSFPSTLAQAILHAPASALNALSAL